MFPADKHLFLFHFEVFPDFSCIKMILFIKDALLFHVLANNDFYTFLLFVYIPFILFIMNLSENHIQYRYKYSTKVYRNNGCIA